MTGLRASSVAAEVSIEIGGRRLGRRRTFSAAAEGEAFWYENANGLIEISVNRGRADRDLGLEIGTVVSIVSF